MGVAHLTLYASVHLYYIHKIQYQLVALHYLLLVTSPICFSLTLIGSPQGVLYDITSIHFNLPIRVLIHE